MQLTRTHRILSGVVAAGAVIIAGIGFAGSYAAVRELAVEKGFGNFSYVFPIGVDAGICVLLALDLLLTWIRMPFPLLRQTAWLLTVATVVFNAAAATDPLGRAMHAVIPVLFVVTVEAARHAVGRIADITADKHMEGVRITRWLLSPLPTFLLWRRMKLWELRSYEQVIKLEQERLVYQARLRSRFGRAWRRKAPVESLMPLRLARYGVPLEKTAPAGLAAAGIEQLPLLPVGPETDSVTSARPTEPAPAAEAPEPSVGTGQRQKLEPGAAQPAVGDLAVQAEQLAALDVRLAYDSFVHYYGGHPAEARQFAKFLAAAHQVGDPVTGAPIDEALLLPVLAELRKQTELPGQQQQGSGGVPAPSNSHVARGAGRESGTEAPVIPGASPHTPGNEPVLESPQGWNAAPGTAQILELDDSNSAFQRRPVAETAGTPADRTGGSNRVSVQMRVPAQTGDLDSTVASEYEPPVEEDEVDELDDRELDEAPAPASADGLKGVDLVEWHYLRLTEETRKLSANKLAPQLAELMPGYTVGSVRKYIGDLRRAAKQSESV
ncbi:DUF2637 domain-containing protein [Streptomyces sp. TRM68367]|uniref:DUF2637 domain-containing protein n=1 Tax=Streptomyces sp. TRM68367 TaxID=2758415 RepID=UPI0021D36137|nr:DUF2637 domain-containing protein [Streptomyces sp. TRM68367]